MVISGIVVWSAVSKLRNRVGGIHKRPNSCVIIMVCIYIYIYIYKLYTNLRKNLVKSYIGAQLCIVLKL